MGVGRGGRLKRSYSSSAFISTLHARRFSVPVSPEKKYVIPAKQTARRFSAQYTPQIQKDYLKQVAEADVTPTGTLICHRLIALLICVLILGAGVVVRLFVVVPYEEKPVCIPVPETGSWYPILPANGTLPWCSNFTINA